MRFFKEVWGFIFELNSPSEYVWFLLGRLTAIAIIIGLILLLFFFLSCFDKWLFLGIIIMCTFFHATNRSFHENEPFSIDMFEGEVTYDHKKRSKPEQSVNELLDESRPKTVPLTRTKCIYLFGNLLQCKEYAIRGMIEHIYEVKCNEYYGPYPMVLVKKCNANTDNTHIRVEYWQPKHKWKVMEFITSSFVVLSEIPFQRKPIMMADYSDDFILAKKVFG